MRRDQPSENYSFQQFRNIRSPPPDSVPTYNEPNILFPSFLINNAPSTEERPSELQLPENLLRRRDERQFIKKEKDYSERRMSNDRFDQYQRSQNERSEWNNYNSRFDQSERFERSEYFERNGRNERSERFERSEYQDRSERYDGNERFNNNRQNNQYNDYNNINDNYKDSYEQFERPERYNRIDKNEKYERNESKRNPRYYDEEYSFNTINSVNTNDTEYHSTYQPYDYKYEHNHMNVKEEYLYTKKEEPKKEELNQKNLPYEINKIIKSLKVINENNREKVDYSDVMWKFQGIILDIKQDIDKLKLMNCDPLAIALNKIFGQLYTRAVEENIPHDVEKYKQVDVLHTIINDIIELPLFSREQSIELEDIRIKIQDILPSYAQNEIGNQRELRGYLQERGLDTTHILIEICDPEDLDSFMKAIGELEVIFSQNLHEQQNYCSMIKELNGLNSQDGSLFATPFFLLTKAFNCSVIKKQFEGLIRVLSQALKSGFQNFFTDDQIPQVDEMLNRCYNFAKSKPERFGKKLQLKKDGSIYNFGYVNDYVQKNRQ